MRTQARYGASGDVRMHCRICENSAGNEAYEVAEMMFGTRDRFGYFRCAACGCLQIADYPENVARYYGPDYYAYRARTDSTLDRFRSRLRDRYAVGGRGPVGRYLYNRDPNKSLANLASVLGDRSRSILDVGCGSGALLRTLDAIGFHDVLGADPLIDDEIRFGRRGRVLKKSHTELDGAFDVVMFHHSFEHLPRPRDMLAHAARLLAPGGTCVIGLPLADSFAWDHYGVDWVQLDAPRHLYLHTAGSLQRLADAAQLTIVKTIYDSTAFQFWGSEQYRRGMPLVDERSLAKHVIDGSLFSRADVEGYVRRAAELNAEGRGDQALFFMKRAA